IAQRKTGPIRAGEVLRLAAPTPAPDRTDGVQDPSRRQAVAARFGGRAGGGPVRIASHELVEESPARCPMNRAIHAASATQRRVGRVGDGIDALTRDVAGFELEARPLIVRPAAAIGSD